jgi:hypothetical protein
MKITKNDLLLLDLMLLELEDSVENNEENLTD